MDHRERGASLELVKTTFKTFKLFKPFQPDNLGRIRPVADFGGQNVWNQIGTFGTIGTSKLS
jgi:hypothetical protein